MSLTKLETETVINFNDAEGVAYISTRQRSMVTRMKKLGVEPNYSQADYDVYEVPKKWIKISPPRKLTEKQLEARRATLARINSEGNSGVRVREPRVEH